MARRRKFDKKKGILILKTTIFLIIILLIWAIIDSIIQKPIKETAEYRTKLFASEIINKSIQNAIKQSNFTYDDLVTVKRNNDNNVTSIEANTINITNLQTNVTQAIIHDLNTLTETSVKIPIGSLLGSQFLSGRGPSVSMRFVLGSYVTSKITSQFDTAGVNQTSHSIIISTDIEITTILSGYHVRVSLPNDFIAAQTVIVGTVPSYYTKIITESKDLLNATDAYNIKGAN